MTRSSFSAATYLILSRLIAAIMVPKLYNLHLSTEDPRLFRYTSLIHKQKIAAQDFRELIDGKEASEVEASLRRIQELRGDTTIKGMTPMWGIPIKIDCEGIKWRNEWNGTVHSVRVFNGNEWIEYEGGMQQATIKLGRANQHVFTLDNLCQLPTESAANEIRRGRKKLLPSGEVMVETGTQKIVFQPATGFVVLHSSDAGKDKRLHEIRQASPQELEGGFVFPRSRVYAQYEGDHVRSFDILLFDTAELNRGVPPQAFVVSAPPNTNVVDTRDNMQKVVPTKIITKAVPDVLVFANDGGLKPTPKRQPLQQRPRRTRWEYAGLCLPLVILTILVLYKRRKSASSN